MKKLLKISFLGIILSLSYITNASTPKSSLKKTEEKTPYQKNNVTVRINNNDFNLPNSLEIPDGASFVINLSTPNNNQEGLKRLISALIKLLSGSPISSSSLGGIEMGIKQESIELFIQNFSDLIDLLNISIALKIYKPNNDDSKNEKAREVIEDLYRVASANNYYANRITARKITFPNTRTSTADYNRIKQIQSNYNSISSKISALTIDMTNIKILNGSIGEMLYLSPDGATIVLVDGKTAYISNSFIHDIEHDQSFPNKINSVCFNNDSSYIAITSDGESSVYLADSVLSNSFDSYINELGSGSGGSECKFNNDNILAIYDKASLELKIYEIAETSKGAKVISTERSKIEQVVCWDFYNDNTIVYVEASSAKDKKIKEKLKFANINNPNKEEDIVLNAVGNEISAIKVVNDFKNQNDPFIMINVTNKNNDATYIVKKVVDNLTDITSIKQYSVGSSGWISSGVSFFPTSINNVKVSSSSAGSFVAAIENNVLKLYKFYNSKFEKINIKEIKGSTSPMRLYNVLEESFAVERYADGERHIIIIDPQNTNKTVNYSKIQKYGINPNGQSMLTAIKDKSRYSTKINIGDQINSPDLARVVLEDESFDASSFAEGNNKIFAIKLKANSDWVVIDIL